MGGRGNSAARNKESSINEQLRSYYDELNTRNYGKALPGSNVPKDREEEFRKVFSQIINHYKDYPEDADKLYFPISGFTYYSKNPDKYLHTPQKLNQYSNILRNEVRGTIIDLRLNVIDENRAKLELQTYKSIEAMIKERKKLLKNLN